MPHSSKNHRKSGHEPESTHPDGAAGAAGAAGEPQPGERRVSENDALTSVAHRADLPEADPSAVAEPNPAEQAQEYLDLLKRTRADYANYRRRVEEERAQQAREATRALVMRLLPILDDFERALGSAQADELESSWARGIQLIERNLRSALAAEGVETIEAQGAEFNPWEHEALMHQPTADAEEGTVLQVVRPGYRIKDKVIRPAQVVVARRSEG